MAFAATAVVVGDRWTAVRERIEIRSDAIERSGRRPHQPKAVDSSLVSPLLLGVGGRHP